MGPKGEHDNRHKGLALHQPPRGFHVGSEGGPFFQRRFIDQKPEKKSWRPAQTPRNYGYCQDYNRFQVQKGSAAASLFLSVGKKRHPRFRWSCADLRCERGTRHTHLKTHLLCWEGSPFSHSRVGRVGEINSGSWPISAAWML